METALKTREASSSSFRRVEGSGLRVWGFRDLGFRVYGSGFRVQGDCPRNGESKGTKGVGLRGLEFF